MMSVRLPVLALLAFLAPALTGCDDGTSPGDADLGDLDASDLVLALNDLVAPLDASSTAKANLNAAVEDLTDAGIVWRRVGSVVRERAWHHVGLGSLAFSAPLPPFPVTFPPEVMGQTFIFDFEAQRWETDDTRVGAPSDGVRLIWYTVDGSGRIRFPLEERGYIDVRPGSGAGDAMDISVVETAGSGGTVLLDFLQNRDSTDGDAQVEWFTAEGFFADESGSSNFDLASEQTVDGATADSIFDLNVTLENVDTRYAMEVDGTKAGGSGEFQDRLTATVVRDGASTVVDLVFEGTGSTQEEASGTLVRNGTLLANITIAGNGFDFTTPDGGSFSSGQTNDLNALFNSMTRAGFEVLLNLPLVLP